METEYIAAICRCFCAFYKEGKNSAVCGGYSFLKNQLTLSELKLLSELTTKSAGSSEKKSYSDTALENLVCQNCEFLTDGCDFAENHSSPPCGGYIFIKKLIE